MKAEQLVDLISKLPRDNAYQYVGNADKRILITGVTAPSGPIRFRNTKDTAEKSVSATMIETVAREVKENSPFNIDKVLSGTGNTRSPFEALIAHTAPFYFCYPQNSNNKRKHLVYCPDTPHENGTLTEKHDAVFPQQNNEDQETLFQKWLSRKGKAKRTILNYSGYLRSEIRRLIEVDSVEKVLFNYTDTESFADASRRIEGQHSFKEENDRYHQGFSAALKAYREFLKESTDKNSGESADMDENKSEIDYIPFVYAPYLAAIRTKPFILLAGISGTGKSRLVRKLAEATCPESLTDKQKPGNFEMIQVRPNWHDSTELMGYVSRISGKPEYVVTGFVRFLAKAWLFPEAPFFLCLDEMNLAPVEQYFAEYLSVIETRKSTTDELDLPQITTDVLMNLDKNIIEQVLSDVFSADWAKPEKHGKVEELKTRFRKDGGIRIPANLVVMGTVNMDETTFSFSRKVLDRAMSFELNEVDLLEGLDREAAENSETIPATVVAPRFVEGRDVYEDNQGLCDKVLEYLKAVNEHLEGTPFKIAYRARNEIMVYVVERTVGESDLPTALDEATALKILPRIEGDEQKITKGWLDTLSMLIADKLAGIAGQSSYPPEGEKSVSLDKLVQMAKRLEGGYTSFWS